MTDTTDGFFLNIFNIKFRQILLPKRHFDSKIPIFSPNYRLTLPKYIFKLSGYKYFKILILIDWQISILNFKYESSNIFKLSPVKALRI